MKIVSKEFPELNKEVTTGDFPEACMEFIGAIFEKACLSPKQQGPFFVKINGKPVERISVEGKKVQDYPEDTIVTVDTLFYVLSH